MRKYARIDDRKVAELFDTDGDISTMFHPDLDWVEVKKGDGPVAQGWSYNGQFSPPPVPVIYQRAEWKLRRAEQVASIKVTTRAGHIFDGDEESQGRMARSILVLQTVPGSTVTWIMADNSVYEVDIAELTEALFLSATEQHRLWILEA